MKKAVIFDMDGVLINSEYFYFKRRMDFFDSLGIEPATRNFKDFVGLSDRMIWEKLVPNDFIKRKLLKEKYIKYREINKIEFKKVLNNSVEYVFMELKKREIKLAIASSSEKKEIFRMIKECELEKYIDFVISGEECIESKPNPDIYIKTIKALNILPKEALAIEDSLLGIQSAKAAGLEVAALYQKDYDLDQSQARYKIKDLKEIIELI
ncbi:haloacid dehalogenase superfamily, subfamily IA, variant 3 with third motif having DD or ED/haloacid dehalogenase superfamily, subfamily IA, variant 1 with third motif having Dx(3-4)D or Dx(3-4)E [Clostridium sp. USBA 49]|uniref:HAD family hydrolase n=1 Tax=Clostridium sp. USBA 49 TaxID=1881060 RepID=UPI00099A5A67|nr:HAD family phosphatase [Clostridium sp. USBA 49]SKA79006.1 haloacid dehalogenase superfamily, subfamily IA, variant 3 with third motif having DD or ED/haloacid dehalogenase superfamily, subfamily IA, variant 1 with third motif having Dx(3-4)D or Dx(3-4)E [Clostridium sp. USBA 49]